MQHPGGGPSHPNSAMDMQRLQQQLQAQYQRTQQQQGGAQQQTVPGYTQGLNPTFAMMQQQQQLQQSENRMPQQHANTAAGSGGGVNMLESAAVWGGAQQSQSQPEHSLDASTGSSARLMAMAGMNPVSNPLQQQQGTPSAQNMQALMQQQLTNRATLTGNFQQAQQQMLQTQQGKQNTMFQGHHQVQQQQIMLAGNEMAQQGQQGYPSQSLDTSTGGTMPSNVTTSQQILFQQQFANLQKQMQQGGTSAVAANAAVAALRNAAANLQMQPPPPGSNPTLPSNGSASYPIMRQQHQQPPQQHQQQQQFYMPQQNDPNMLMMGALQRPPQFQKNSNQNSLGMHSVSSQASLNSASQTTASLTDQQQIRMQQQAMMQQQQSATVSVSQGATTMQGWPVQQTTPPQYACNPMQQQHQAHSMIQESPHLTSQPQQSSTLGTNSSRSNSTARPQQATQSQQSNLGVDDRIRAFLDGSFAGGWQSNKDLPDRRRVIFQILDVIRMMRPEHTKMNDNLEEHLYRSAPSKEEYLNMATLKTRLQAIAQGLEIHRSSSSTSLNSQQGMSASQSASANIFGLQQQHSHQNDASTPLPIMEQENVSWGQAVQPSSQQQGSYNQHMSQQQHDLISQHQGSVNSVTQTPQQQMDSGSMRSAYHGSSNHSSSSSGLAIQQQNAGWANMQQQSNSLETSSHSMMGQLNPNPYQQQQEQSGYLASSNQQSLSAMNTATTGSGFQASMSMGHAAQQTHQQPQQLSVDLWGMGVSNATQDIGDSASQFDSTGVNSARFQDTDSVQKKKVIAQQQQRLLLLRHASKCNAGPACSTRFCSQMVTLWRHMKSCRDKNCRTPHCLSSRCVLNHYRICKSQGKTATCEVCGPVMVQIKQLERDDGTVDPLVGHNDPQQVNVGNTQQQQMSVAVSGGQSRLQQFDMSNQLQQHQQMQAQMKLRIEQLQQLQKQQTQLLEQQKRLQEQEQRIEDPNSQQAYQLHQQQTLLGELQKRCQQQQQLLQTELQQQSGNVTAAPLSQVQPQQLLQSSSRLTQNLHVSSAQQLQAGLSIAAQPIHAQMTPTSTSQLETMPIQQSTVDNEDMKEPNSLFQGKSISRVEAVRRGSGSGLGKGFANLTAARSDMPKSQKKRNTSTSSAGRERSQKKAKAAAALALAPVSQNLDVSERSMHLEIMPSRALGTSLIASMKREEITRHIESLNKRVRLSSRTVSHKCMPIIQDLIDDQFGWVFADPVDPVALGLPDYFEVVKNPMHLDLVKKKVENAIYADVESFARDAKLVFENAILYNGEESEVGELARSMLLKFDQLYNAVLQSIAFSQKTLESSGQACSLCGTQNRKYEPTVLYCRGKCGMQRIKRQESYVTDRTKQNHWCINCYRLLNPDEPIVLDDGTEILKKDLQELKNDAQPEEGWVNCDECHAWVHQICALFNGRTNKSNAAYTCPNCYLKKIDTGLLTTPVISVKGASDLPQSKLSQAIEKGLVGALQVAYESRAKELAVRIEEVEKAEGLSVRVLSHVEKKHVVGSEMLQRYGPKGCTTEFPVKSKCIALFQKIDGVDTFLFAVYVYEYGQDCPAPNRRRVYISYLDSVQYFEPRCYRTTVYQTILVEYLRHVKSRGFHTAHIWSCPPTPGDDYIFLCHPEHQKFPREDMLRAWYHKVLEKAKTEGIVIQTTTLYDEYFADDVVHEAKRHCTDPMCLPYFEGDYIPGELENILKSTKQAEDSNVAGDPDDVMRRLGHNVLKMKDNFIVVHLRSRRFAAAVERGEDVSNWPEDSDEEIVRSKRAKISGKGSEAFASVNNAKLHIATPKTTDLHDDASTSHESASAQRPWNQESAADASTDTAESPLEDKAPTGNENTEDSTAVEDLSAAKSDEGERQAEKSEKAAADDSLIVKDVVEAVSEVSKLPSEEKHSDEMPLEVDLDGKSESSSLPLSNSTPEVRKKLANDDSIADAAEQLPGALLPAYVPEGEKDSNEKPSTVALDFEEELGTASSFLTSVEKRDVDDSVTSAAEGEPGLLVLASANEGEKDSDEKSSAFGLDSKEELGIASLPLSGGLSSEKLNIESEKVVLNEPVVKSHAPVSAAQIETTQASEDITDEVVIADNTNESKTETALDERSTQDHSPSVSAVDVIPGKTAGSENVTITTSSIATGEMGTEAMPESTNEQVDVKRRALDGIAPAIRSHFAGEGIAQSSQPVGDTSDADELLESDLFESRQQFLNYCQTNHCQFDEQRRAKHSSMLVLFHLHNPSAPKFLQQCGACYVDITHGVRYHCNNCPDFDLCQDCYVPVTTGGWATRDPRFAHDKSHTFESIDMETEVKQETPAAREEQRKALENHLDLVEHAGKCEGAPACALQNCLRMKGLFDHVRTCCVKPKKDCRTCNRLLTLVAMHSRMCGVHGQCRVPFCDRIRERQTRLRQQQQLMDDRRRQAQNELYHAVGS